MAAPDTRARPELSVVTVNYNVTELLRGMLDSVPAAAAGHTVEIVVVDNASRDGRLEALRRDYPRVTLVESPENLGFARGNNLGVSHARGDVLAFVNPDVVLGPGSLAHLLDFLTDHPRCGLVGPRLVLAGGQTQSFAGLLPTAGEFLTLLPGTRFWQGADHRRRHAAERPVICGFVHGACMVMPRAALERIGGVPTETFMYGEELLLGHRLGLAGFEIWYDPTVTVSHSEESSANRSFSSHDKALRKRWGHTIARAEILGRPSFLAWNSVMASRALASTLRARLTGCAAGERHHRDLLRMHLSAFGTLRAPAIVDAPPSADAAGVPHA